MSRMFRIDEKAYDNILADIRKQLPKLTSDSTGFRVEYAVQNVREKEPVNIEFTPSAYIKTVQLLCANKDEVGWDGAVTKVGPKHYLIEDIFVYPQQVSAAKVDTDDNEYAKYLSEFDDETFSKLRLNAHSHVRMSPPPSGTDLADREKVVYQIKDNDFYIFMIWNKYMTYTCEIYDGEDNKVYNTDDCIVTVTDMPEDTFTILDEAKERVKAKTYSYQSNYSSNYPSYTKPANTSYQPAATKKSAGVYPGKGNQLLDDDEIDLITYYGGIDNIPDYLR